MLCKYCKCQSQLSRMESIFEIGRNLFKARVTQLKQSVTVIGVEANCFCLEKYT